MIRSGAISTASVTSRVKNAQTGPLHCQNADKKIQSWLMLTTMKKTFLYRIDTMAKNLGLASMTDQRRVISFGQIAGLETSQLGPRINQTISKKKIVCTHLVWNTAMNGMMWSVAIVTSILVRKVSHKLLASIYWDKKRNRLKMCKYKSV